MLANDYENERINYTRKAVFGGTVKPGKDPVVFI